MLDVDPHRIAGRSPIRESSRPGAPGVIASEAIAIGVDVGGSKMAVGIVHADGTISGETRIGTERQSPDWVTERIVDYARENGPGLPVGVAANGPVDHDGVVRYGTYIPWGGYPLGARLAEELGVRTFVQNDVTVAAWGEYILDPARRSVVVIAVGTGVGGGAVSDGRLLVGQGAAMEIGHLTGQYGNRICVCGKVGCLESVASGSAVAAEYRIRRPAAKLDTPGNVVTGRAVVAAAREGDPVAISVLRDAGTALGEAAALLASVLDPERIVFTGGLALGADELILGSARTAFLERLAAPNASSRDILEKSTAEVDAVMLGAGALAADVQGARKR